jgi:lipopolysaccharide/colanic/teichoic acid biosynthesis glycosyltransferase
MQILSILQKGGIQGHNGRRNGAVALTDDETGLYFQEYFNDLLNLEKKRCERSQESILLMLFDLSAFTHASEIGRIARLITGRLSDLTRQTDIKGWYADHTVLGVIYTDVKGKGTSFKGSPAHIVNKCCASLGSCLGFEQYSQIEMTWQVFPEEFPLFGGGEGSGRKKRADVASKKSKGNLSLLTKRVLDIAGSIFAIGWFSPVFIGISILIKMNSEGPVLFKQERIGLGGKKFLLFKFRSMYVNNDSAIHQEYIKKFMAEGKDGANEDGVFKIKNDPRITPIGRMLRKTSLDELPQFFNVLMGDMSLVGPRPPIRYECEDYRVWHRRRVLDMKPGITGLWQVMGRSATTFDEMVRMDLRYIREWSVWLDIKIILKTPLVMLTGAGGY